MKCGLIIGHKKNRPGGYNEKYNITEYQFNKKLAHDIYSEIQTINTDVMIQIIERNTYKSLPDDINQLSPNFCISLHCNAYNKKVNGTETLYYHNSTSGKKLAQIVQKNIVKALQFKDRGVLPRKTEDRGGYLLRYTDMPCVITEPFFLDNDKSYKTVMDKYQKLVTAFVESIIEISHILQFS